MSEERLTDYRRLIRAAKALESNEHWLLIKAHLFKLAPPGQDVFWPADGYNTHAAARRDGAKQLTRLLEDLVLEREEEEPKPTASKGTFTGPL